LNKFSTKDGLAQFISAAQQGARALWSFLSRLERSNQRAGNISLAGMAGAYKRRQRGLHVRQVGQFFAYVLKLAECVNDFATPCVINLLCGVVYLFAPPVLEG